MNIIIITTLIVLGIYIVFQHKFILFVKNEDYPILSRTFISFLFQFGIAGLGISIVAIFRKENFINYGLNSNGIIKSIVLSTLCFIPYIILHILTNQFTEYLPFQSVWVTKEVLQSSLPVKIIGISLITLAWGFFEGFNYVVISNKINIRYPSKSKWLIFVFLWNAF